MLYSLPQPILSLAEERLQSVQGQDAALDLFTLFTKCKHHIEDGARLENISLRIWHRDSQTRRCNRSITGNPSLGGIKRIESAESCSSSSSDSDRLSSLYFSATRNDYHPSSRLDDSTATPVPSSPKAPASRATVPSALTPSSLIPGFNQVRRAKSPAISGSRQVGKTIAKILPNKLSISPPPHRMSFSSGSTPKPPPLGRNDTDSGIAESVQENDETDNEKPALRPLVVIPASPPVINEVSSSSGPRVVIVNPTPHPTPPATPEMYRGSTSVTRSPTTRNDMLSPPEMVPSMCLPGPAVTISSTATPTASTSSNAGIGVSVSTDATSSTGSSDERVPTGKMFFMPKSSPQSQSSGKGPLTCTPPPSAPQQPISSQSSNIEHDDQQAASFVSTSSNMHSVASSRMHRKGKTSMLRHGKKGSRGKFALPTGRAGMSGGSGPSQPPSQMPAKKSAVRQNSLPSGSQPTRLIGPKLRSRSGSPVKRSRESGASEARVHHEPTQRPNTLTRVATQPLPHAHQPQNLFLHLQQPLVPNANARRRKVEIEKSSTEEEDWSDVSQDVEEEEVTDDSQRDKEDNEEDAVLELDGPISELSKAAKEAAIQRDFFKKLPSRSYTNLTQRSKSGLLTELFKPPVEWFPEDHAYRNSRSHHDLVPKRQPPGAGPMLWFKQAAKTTVAEQPPVSAVSPPAASVRLSTSKSAVALPEMAKVSAIANRGESSVAGYRPRGPPVNLEESDSEEEDPDDTVQMSHSVAHRRLEALASNTGKLPETQSALSPNNSLGQSGRRKSSPSPLQQEITISRAPVTARPVVLGYPYNLPTPEPPQSVNAVRSRMYDQELTGSTRISLLRERYHSYQGGAPQKAEKTVRKLSPEKAAEELRRTRLMRNKSWGADDFHTTGW